MIKPDLVSRGLTLWQDRDLAHTSKSTLAWFLKNNVLYITSPSNSLDLLIWGLYAHPLENKYFKRRSRTRREALARFTKV